LLKSFKSLALIAVVSIGIVGCGHDNDDYSRQQSYNQQTAPTAAAPVIIQQAAPSGYSGSDVALGAIAGGLVGHAMANNSRPAQQYSDVNTRPVINKTVTVNHVYNTPAPAPVKVASPTVYRSSFTPAAYKPSPYTSSFSSSRSSGFSSSSSMSSRSSSFGRR